MKIEQVCSIFISGKWFPNNHLAKQKSNMFILFPFWMEVVDKLSSKTKLQQFSPILTWNKYS
jgi:hypothetical protein